MKKIIVLALILIISTVAAFAGDRRIAFERRDAVYMANLDGTAEKKIADGIFPAISPDGTRVAFNTVEKTNTTYARHIAVVEIETSKTTVFKDVPSDNSYYPTWSPDGKRILFTLRPNEVWDLGLINVDGTDFRVLKKGDSNEVRRYSPVWARDGQSVFCQNMANIYRLGLDGVVLAQWKIEKIIPNGDMSGDGRIDISPDGKRLLLGIDMARNPIAKIGTALSPLCGYSTSIRNTPSDSLPENFSAGTVVGSITTTSFFSVEAQARKKTRSIGCRPTART